MCKCLKVSKKNNKKTRKQVVLLSGAEKCVKIFNKKGQMFKNKKCLKIEKFFFIRMSFDISINVYSKNATVQRKENKD